VHDNDLPVKRTAKVLRHGYHIDTKNPGMLVLWQGHEIVVTYKELEEPKKKLREYEAVKKEITEERLYTSKTIRAV
jgi:hypothetical protein